MSDAPPAAPPAPPPTTTAATSAAIGGKMDATDAHAPLVHGAGFGVMAFVHVAKRAWLDVDLRRAWLRSAVAQIAITLAVSLLVAIPISRIPVLILDSKLLPKLTWETNRATIVLVAAFFVEWIVAAVFRPATRAITAQVAAAAGVAAPAAQPAAGALAHRARVVAPMLVVSALWTAALCVTAWLGLKALVPHASQLVRLAVTAAVGGLLVVLPLVPLAGAFVLFIADRVGRVAEPMHAVDVVKRAPGEIVGLALATLAGSFPLSYLLWRPLTPVAAALVRRTRVDRASDRTLADAPPHADSHADHAALPAGLDADPVRTLKTEARAGWQLVKDGALDARPTGRVQIASAWIALVGLGVDKELAGPRRGHITIAFGATAIAAVVTIFAIVEWIVVALSRQFHDVITMDAARLVGVPHDDEEVVAPRVHVDRRWIWTKVKRRAQGMFVLVLCALPWIIGVLLLTLPIAALLQDAVVLGWFLNAFVNGVANAVLAAIAFYWGGVFLIGKTGHAWRNEAPHGPVFVRVLERARDRWPLAAWPLGAYLWVMRRALGLVPRPASLYERMPLEAAGITVARFLCVIPGVYLVFRPVLPVAVGVLLKHRAPEALPQEMAPVTPQSDGRVKP